MKRSICLLLILLCAGCAQQKTEIRTVGLDEQIPKTPLDYSSGSLWQAASSGGITEDVKAHRRGDIITIVISETASASKKASTDTGRSSSVSAGMPNFLGLEKAGMLKNNMDLSQLINANVDSKFSGSGSTSRQENLTATISAKVIDVLSNGNLLIEGRRNIKVNNEDQEIVLTGTVRQRDISPDNVVNSIYVSDAKISYSGRGIISDRQSPGWLMNIVDKIWPF
ncbi:flagellar basal body L-ring protein FlgH [Oryzomonas japonica]|uniref:Flagellar L-ring protein n=1 Tax=Oryzomonas japonica TaxID=2603858 RepID=A0A7J4ZVS0_9BACT|nr:flagellar basal body L-ring protein FlgH [Oryzomonas japonica]KAB0667205.1 flagellar basal body L-ring protein FlgH [Oryzomonas japonica]